MITGTVTVVRSQPKALKEARQRAGHSTRSLAQASGVSQQRISDLEADGGAGVRPTTAKLLADALGVDITKITVLETEAVTG